MASHGATPTRVLPVTEAVHEKLTADSRPFALS